MSTAEHVQVPMASSAPPEHHRDHHDGERAPQRRSWAVLALALVAQVLVVLDISVVNTALPTIGAELHLGSSDLQWLVTAYLLMSGGGLLLGGRIADLLSRRRVLLTGLFVFTSASLVSGFASTAGVLIGARAAQGLGAALMTPAALAIIMTTYSGVQRAKGLALWGAVGGMGIAAGVLVGGVITTWAGWQMIFWVNVPIGVAAIATAIVILPKHGAARTGLSQLDVPGAAVAVAGLGGLLFGIQSAASDGWWSPRTLVVLAVSGGLLVAFTVTRLGSHLLGRSSPRIVATCGLALAAAGALLLSRVSADARFATDLLPGFLVLGLGVGLVFVAVSITAMAGIPAEHAGMASGFLMTGHEIGAALGVAVLAAVATAAGDLTTLSGAATGFSWGFVAAAIIAAGAAATAFLAMPAARVSSQARMHMH